MSNKPPKKPFPVRGVKGVPVTDPAERQAVLAEIVADLNQPHDPGTIRPTRLEDWADSRLMRISFRHQP